MMEQEIKVLFIAIPIIEQEQALSSMQGYFERTLNPHIDRGAFRPSKDLHLTIAYIGSISTERIPDIEQAIVSAMAKLQFGDQKPQLLWQYDIQLFNNAVSLTFVYDEKLYLLAKLIRDALKLYEIPFDDRHAFTTHLTIGRIKPFKILKKPRIKRKILELLAQKTAHQLQPINVWQVGLYESGAIEPFKTFDLS